jgi:micrococcal nuclease
LIVKLHNISALIFLTALVAACAGTSQVPTSTARATSVPAPTDGEQVTIAHVVDGDTVELDDGRRVRYVGINTPEQAQPYYDQATEANRHLVDGRTAWMALDAQTTDRFGRILAYLWVDEQFVNLELVRQGYANAYTEPPNVRYSEQLLAAEQEARDAKVGLWAPSSSSVRITEIHADAPGPDQENPNGEWLALLNDGSEAVDLAGFTLKDGANHIYTFPAVSLSPGRRLQVHSGQGQDDGATLYWGLSDDSVWNNGGDTAYLRDPEGRLVDSYSY